MGLLKRPSARSSPNDLDPPRGLLLACVLSLVVWLLLVYILERVSASGWM